MTRCTTWRLRRTGFCLLMSLVILAVAGLLLLQSIRQVRAAHAVVDLQIGGRQAHWLARAGESLARARLRQNPAYAGEVWTVPPGELTSGAAQVAIVVEPVQDQPQFRRVQISAQYGVAPPRRLRTERTFVLDVNTGALLP